MENDKKNKNITEQITSYVDMNFQTILATCFGRFAKYVIQDRALPDARDGLKPVQRRVIYAMYSLGLFHQKDFKKSARIVGEVIGKYHPHGDTSIYDAMIRMSQPWKLNIPLINVHGNNGSIDGDSPAAMRYTEAKLFEITNFLIGDIEKKIIPFQNNFDDSEQEPLVFPSLLPNLLLNGASGIAAGYATEIPPHNIQELIDAIVHKILHPDCALEELLNFIQGPDFPTGGQINLTKNELNDIYTTGKGRIYHECKLAIKKGKFKYYIEITEIPYALTKENLILSIYKVRENHLIHEITEIVDQSDRKGLSIIIKTNCDNLNKTQNLKEYLLTHSFMRHSYSYNMIAIAQNKPVLLGLVQIINIFIEFQHYITKRSINFDLAKHKAKLNITAGLIKSISIIDEVIKLVREASNRQDVIANLIQKFQFNEEQAIAIADLRLYRLSNTDIRKLVNEKKVLQTEIARLENILANPSEINKYIIDYLVKIKETFTIQRRTKINHQQLITNYKEQILEKDFICTITKDGYFQIRYTDIDILDNPQSLINKNGDVIISVLKTNTLDKLLIITNKGNYVLLNAYEITNNMKAGELKHLYDLRKLSGAEKIISVLNIKHNKDDANKILNLVLILISKFGRIKKITLDSFKPTKIKAMPCFMLDTMDDLKKVLYTKKPKNILIFTNNKYLFYSLKEIPYQTLKTSGVRAIKLRANMNVVEATLITEQANIGVVLNNRKLKVINIEKLMFSKRTNVPNPLLELTPNNKIIYVVNINNQSTKMGYWVIGLSSKTTSFLPTINSAQLKRSVADVPDSEFTILSLNSFYAKTILN